MKLFNFLTAALTTVLSVTMSSAQMVSIASPPANQILAPGEAFVLQLDSSDGLTGFEQVSVAIGIQSGSSNSTQLGTMLFAGNFTPQIHDLGKPAYQNFSLTVPSTFESGPGLLNVAHFYLIGAGLMPVLEMRNSSLMITS